MSPHLPLPRRLLLPLFLATTAATSASAGPAKVDWSRGVVTAEGIGLADRHAPNPAVARGTSRRTAEDAAKMILRAAVADLQLAAGGTVGAKAKDDAAVKERLARAVAHALTLSAEPETDGAWRVTMAVPIEAVRLALTGPRAITSDDSGPPVVVVEGVTVGPGVGWKVAGLDAASIWVDTLPAWASGAPHVKATGGTRTEILVDGTGATAATLFVIVRKP